MKKYKTFSEWLKIKEMGGAGGIIVGTPSAKDCNSPDFQVLGAACNKKKKEEKAMTFKEWLLLEENKPVIIISGIHGDEKAPVIAMKKFIREHGQIDGFILIPSANPSALEKETRRGKDNKDLNRQFCDPLKSLPKKIWDQVKNCRLLITLHEWDGKGAFAYHSGSSTRKLAKQFVDIASKEFGIAHPKEKYLKNIKNGLISDDETESFSRFKCALETYAKNHNIEYITAETPVGENLNKRVNVYYDFINTIIKS